jgi:replicative DNA helicase
MNGSTADMARQLIEGPPTDTAPQAGPPWLTIADIGKLPTYQEGLPTITTGFETFDRALNGGFRPESVYILAGRTGSAKSTLASNIVRRVALTGACTLLFKLEESPVEAVWRMHAAASQIDLSRLLDGAKLCDGERAALRDGWTLIEDLPIRVSDARNIFDIDRIATEHAADGGKLVVIDQLSMIEYPGAAVGYETATQISAHLRTLARRLHLPILLVVQVNRAASRGRERLTCNDLRDSGALENDACAVLLIDRVRPPDVWGTDPFTLEILVGKNRSGRTTRDRDAGLELLWWPRCCRVEDGKGAQE